MQKETKAVPDSIIWMDPCEMYGVPFELIPLKAVREFYARLQDPKELVEIDRANHLFDGQASEVGDALEELLSDYSCKTL